MTWKTHMIGGAVAGAGATLLYQNLSKVNLSFDTMISIITISAMSALLPDVDEIRSKAGKILLPVSLILFILQSITRIITFFTFGRLKARIRENTRFLMHRGICHYPITVFIVSITLCLTVIVTAADKKVWLIRVVSFTIGLLSHIILDIISGKIALLFPISKKRVGIKLVESGGFFENFLVRPVLLVLCLLTIVRIAG